MKKTVLIICVLLAFFKTQAQLQVSSNGYVKATGGHWTGGLEFRLVNIGTFNMVSLLPKTPWYGSLGTLSNFYGYAYIDHIYSPNYDTWPSDGRLKENVKNITNGIALINKLRPVHYDVVDSFYDKIPEDVREKVKAEGKHRMGFIAQEVAEIFPHMVHQEPVSGYYGIGTMDLIPVLVEAIKEQQIQIDALKYQLQNPDKTKRESEEELVANATHLEQNFPNPFDTETSVSYFIAPEVNSAAIMIFDMKGTLLRTYDKLEKGKGEIVIESGQLTPGMYMYSLIINGVELDNKRMILTE